MPIQIDRSSPNISRQLRCRRSTRAISDIRQVCPLYQLQPTLSVGRTHANNGSKLVLWVGLQNGAPGSFTHLHLQPSMRLKRRWRCPRHFSLSEACSQSYYYRELGLWRTWGYQTIQLTSLLMVRRPIPASWCRTAQGCCTLTISAWETREVVAASKMG